MTQRGSRFIIWFLAALFLSVLIFPLMVYAQGDTYKPLVGIPGLPTDGNTTMQEYVNALYLLSITVASILAVLKLIYAGVQYMFSEIVTDKSQAKKDIKGALLGLLIIIGAVTILNEINPNLGQLKPLRQLTGSFGGQQQAVRHVDHGVKSGGEIVTQCLGTNPDLCSCKGGKVVPAQAPFHNCVRPATRSSN